MHATASLESFIGCGYSSVKDFDCFIRGGPKK